VALLGARHYHYCAGQNAQRLQHCALRVVGYVESASALAWCGRSNCRLGRRIVLIIMVDSLFILSLMLLYYICHIYIINIYTLGF